MQPGTAQVSNNTPARNLQGEAKFEWVILSF